MASLIAVFSFSKFLKFLIFENLSQLKAHSNECTAFRCSRTWLSFAFYNITYCIWTKHMCMYICLYIQKETKSWCLTQIYFWPQWVKIILCFFMHLCISSPTAFWTSTKLKVNKTEENMDASWRPHLLCKCSALLSSHTNLILWNHSQLCNRVLRATKLPLSCNK